MVANAKKGVSLDNESRTMLYEGCNLSQLGALFRMDHRVLVEKLHGVEPSGRRGNAVTYMVHEVAPYLVKPMYDIETYIKRMHHNELPKLLTKEFWAGQRSKQEYLLREGDLWPTAKVIQEVGELFKLIKMQARLAIDAVERQTELTPRQRAIVKGLMDGLLRDLHLVVSEKFADKPEAPAAPAVSTGQDDETL